MRLSAIVLSCIVVLSGCYHPIQVSTVPTSGYLLIDPGHGGFDGGTVAENGTCEKHLNLSIALLLRDMFESVGIHTFITRETDISLDDASADTIRSRKVSDMKQRLQLYEQAETVISLHQNHFSSAQYKGTQVFYSANHTDSQLLANCIQQSAKMQLQPNNNREIKKASNGIYLLHHTTQPAVLVECGFLSNPEERALLETTDYQQQIAFVILSGYFDYLSQKRGDVYGTEK